MNKDELLEKAKELISSGNVDEAKQFVEDHRDELGDYASQAQDLLKNLDTDGLMDKVKGLFK
ncbi:MAG: hypothetical protein ACK5NA_08845 [Enterococcus sp.]